MPVKKGKGCVADVMREWKAGTLHSGRGGEVVKDKDQAVAIALSMCGGARKDKGKSFVEQASKLLDEVKKMPQKSPDEFDLAECSRKKGMSYADCGCPNCKRMPMAIGYPTPQFDETEANGGMALSELRAIADKAMMLAGMITEDTELEPWVASKITRAADYMNSVANHAMYYGLETEEEEGEEDEDMEAGEYGRVYAGTGYEEANDGLEKACWPGYEAIGMKKKGKRMVPN